MSTCRLETVISYRCHIGRLWLPAHYVPSRFSGSRPIPMFQNVQRGCHHFRQPVPLSGPADSWGSAASASARVRSLLGLSGDSHVGKMFSAAVTTPASGSLRQDRPPPGAPRRPPQPVSAVRKPRALGPPRPSLPLRPLDRVAVRVGRPGSAVPGRLVFPIAGSLIPRAGAAGARGR